MKTWIEPQTRRVYSYAVAAGLFWLAFVAPAGPLQLLSVPDPAFGPPAGGGGDSALPVMSRDGRFVLFASTANNLVQIATNQPMPALFPAPLNVFLRDRTNASTTLVSINLARSGGGNADSTPMGISTNGRYALFESSASNLVPGDTDNAAEVFVRDLLSGKTILVSASTNGGFANSDCYSSVITPDGRYVAFTSAADNLVPGDTNGLPDVFLRDLASNTTTLVSVGAQQPTFPQAWVGSDAPVLTPDGRYVAFVSAASNLVSGIQTAGNVYLRDTVAGTTTCVSAGALAILKTLGAATNAVSFNHALSDDGRFVAFEAAAYPNSPPAVILRYDQQTGQAALIDTNAAVLAGGGPPAPEDLAMTPDGRFIAYVANELDTSGETTSIRIWDELTGTNQLASADLSGSVVAGSLSDSPALDDHGRFVLFISGAPYLVTNDIPGDFHLYVRDLQAATTTLVDADTNGVGSPIDPSGSAVMSADGRFVAFDCLDGNLVPFDRNHAYDVFVRDVPNRATELVSAHDPVLASVTPDGSSAISASSLSSDARLIAFWSEADDVVTNGGNGFRQVYVRNRLTGANLLASINTNGMPGDGASTEPAVSPDGGYVVFSSFADDLVNGDNNAVEDVFVSALPNGPPQLVSVNSAGTGPANGNSSAPLLSSNGQFVLFHSKATNLTPGMPSGFENLFLRDLQSHSTYALTTNGVGAAAMTPDGKLVAYITSSSRIYSPNDRLFVWQTQTRSNVYSLFSFNVNGLGLASVAIDAAGQHLAYLTNISSGSQQLWLADLTLNTNWLIASLHASSTAQPRFSADGRFLVYVGAPGALPVTNQVYLFDLQSGTNWLVSQSFDRLSAGNQASDSADVSSDGRFVAYRSEADNLVPNDTNGVPDIFLYDRLNGTTMLLTTNRLGNGSADNRSLTPVFSADGGTLAFVSWASDLVPNDFNTSADIFALDVYNGTSVGTFQLNVLPGSMPANGSWLSWPTTGAASYRVQFKNSLQDSTWQELNGQISVIGSRAYLKDPLPVANQRFYRVIASP